MVSTWLPLRLRKDCVAFAKLNLVVGFQMMELPSDEFVVVWVLICRDHATSPICMNTELLQVSLAQWWEKFEPVVRIGELGNLCFRDVQLHQDFILCKGRFYVVFRRFFQKLLRRLVASGCIICDFTLQTDGRGRDWHSCAMETKWEQGTLAQLSLIASHVFRF